MRRHGIPLLTGKAYTIEFRNPGCVTNRHQVDLAPDAKAGPLLEHKCRWKPAYIKVEPRKKGTAGLVFGRNGKKLGEFGKAIPIPMPDSTHTLTITISSQDKQRDMNVELLAGKTRTIQASF